MKFDICSRGPLPLLPRSHPLSCCLPLGTFLFAPVRSVIWHSSLVIFCQNVLVSSVISSFFYQFLITEYTGIGQKAGPRLREPLPAARGSQEAGFTQPRVHLFADTCKNVPSRESGMVSHFTLGLTLSEDISMYPIPSTSAPSTLSPRRMLSPVTLGRNLKRIPKLWLAR